MGRSRFLAEHLEYVGPIVLGLAVMLVIALMGVTVAGFLIDAGSCPEHAAECCR